MKFLSPIAILALYLTWKPGLGGTCVLAGILALHALACLTNTHKQPWLLRALGALEPSPSESSPEKMPLSFVACLWKDRAFVIPGLGLCVAGFFLLQLQAPYFFSQDDNVSFLMPIWLASLRGLFSGVLPVWNPYPGGGEPILECPNAVLYPFTILAYAISRFLLRNEFTVIEVFALLHLFLGFLGGYWAARQWRMSRPMAVALSLSFIFSGFNVITGRNWITFLSMSAWVPFFLGLLAPLQLKSISWRWSATFALALALSYYTGFSQIWVFLCLFYGIALLLMVVLRVAPVRSVVWHVPAALLGLALAFPLIYVQMDFASDVNRVFTGTNGGHGISLADLPAIAIPPPLIRIKHPMYTFDGDIYAYAYAYYYYINIFFAIALFVTLIALLGLRPSRLLWGNNVLLLTAFPALLLALGNHSPIPLSDWLSSVPWLCKFRDPWRYYIIFEAFAMYAGALIIDRFLSGLRRTDVWRGSVAAGILALLFHCLTLPMPSFSPSPSPPYPPLSLALDDIVTRCSQATPFPQRIADPHPLNSQTEWLVRSDPLSFNSLTANIPSVWGIFSFNRYNTLTWFHSFSGPVFERYNRHFIDACRAYGISWIVCHKRTPPNSEFFVGLGPPRGLDNLLVWEVKGVCPMAFSMSNPANALPVSFSMRGVEANTRNAFDKGGTLVLNVLAWPHFKVYADGTLVPHRYDVWRRIVVDVPAGASRVEALYCVPLGKGVGFALVLAIAAAFTWFGLTRLNATNLVGYSGATNH